MNKIQNFFNTVSVTSKNILKISIGTIGGQAISMIIVPFLTRIYGAEIIGFWAILNSIVLIGTAFSDLALTNAIMLEDKDEDVLKVYQVVSSISLLISILMGMGSLLYLKTSEILAKYPPFLVGIYVAIAIFTLQQVQVCYTWLNKKAEYNILMKNPIINNIAFSLFSLILGILGLKKYGYFIGWTAGQIFTIIHMRRFLPKTMFTFNITSYKEIFIRHNRFLKFQLPTNIIANVKNQIPTLLIEAFWGSTILGYYSMTVKLMLIPITFLANSMGKVFFQQISDMKCKGENIGGFVYHNVTSTMKIGTIPMILILSMGDVISNFVLGTGWEMSGVFIRLMVIQNFLNFQMMTLTGISTILEKQNYAMMSCVMQGIGTLVGLTLGKYVFNNVYIGVTLMSIAFACVQMTYFSALFKVMNESARKYLRSVLKDIFIIFLISTIIRIFLLLIGIVNTF